MDTCMLQGMAEASLSSLPEELLLYIISFLEPADITQLQLVSKHFLQIGRDDTFWRERCFQESSFLEALNWRRQLGASHSGPDAVGQVVSRGWRLSRTDNTGTWSSKDIRQEVRLRERERVRIMANWDPSYPSERVSWYEEYIQRHGTTSISWFQQPHINTTAGPQRERVEARGVALYRPDNPREEQADAETVLAVSPLDDGGVCIWDVAGTKGRKGAIVARTKPGILFIDGPGSESDRRSKRVDSGVTECVSVDSRLHRAFFAVQSHLIEIDLQNLSVVGCESFPWSITALSTASPTVPITVGTNLGIHLHDYRSKTPYRNESIDKVDGAADTEWLGAKYFYERSLRSLFDMDPLPPYAPLSQPGPLSILHLQKPGSEVDLSDDIYVAGRFSNILHYDRRKFPSIQGSIHSGARLCAMTSLPYPFSTLDHEVRRRGELSLEQINTSKTLPGGRTLIACGEYNTKGSLELYGFTVPQSSVRVGGEELGNSVLKNRQTSSSSKLLSVVNHGTRVAVSDGLGYVKWFERDGFTEVRRCRIGHDDIQVPSLFSAMSGADDIARKLLPVRAEENNSRLNNSDLLFWTGEKLGIVGFSSRPGFTAEDFEERAVSAEDAEIAEAEQAHREQMRKALEIQANDARFVRNLGIGSGQRG